MSSLQKWWLIFGPFDTPLADEVAYCYECLHQGPQNFTNDPALLDESAYCRLMLEADEEPGPNFFENATATACNLLESHITSLTNGGSGEPALLFFLPSNFYEQDDD